MISSGVYTVSAFYMLHTVFIYFLPDYMSIYTFCRYNRISLSTVSYQYHLTETCYLVLYFENISEHLFCIFLPLLSIFNLISSISFVTLNSPLQ